MEKRNAGFLHCIPLSWLELKEHGLIFSALYKGLMICDVDICLQLDRCHQLIAQTTRQQHFSIATIFLKNSLPLAEKLNIPSQVSPNFKIL